MNCSEESSEEHSNSRWCSLAHARKLRLRKVYEALNSISDDALQKNRESNSLNVLWAMGWTIGVLGFDSRQAVGIFLFTTAFRTALGPTQPPIQLVPGALSLGVKWLGREADHSPPSSAEVKE